MWTGLNGNSFNRQLGKMDVHDFVPEISAIQLPCKISLVPFRSLPHRASLSPRPQPPIPLAQRMLNSRARPPPFTFLRLRSYRPLILLPSALLSSWGGSIQPMQQQNVPEPDPVCVCLWKECYKVPVDAWMSTHRDAHTQVWLCATTQLLFFIPC